MRHAFGSYRDVLREVAYSPLMAGYLTFLQNKAMAYDGSFPDENFARELMQLFSIGLYRLHPDGTPLRDAAGEIMGTYTNDDIVTFSRAWTGHDLQPRRVNVEADQNFAAQPEGGQNYIDPLRVRPEWRAVAGTCT